MVKSLKAEGVYDSKCALCGGTRDMKSFKSKNICEACINSVKQGV